MKNRNVDYYFSLDIAEYLNKHVTPPISKASLQFICDQEHNKSIAEYKSLKDKQVVEKLMKSFDSNILCKFTANDRYKALLRTNPCKLDFERKKTKKPYINLQSLQLDEEQTIIIRKQTETLQKHLNFPNHYVAFARLFYRSFKDSTKKIIWDDRKNSGEFKIYLKQQLMSAVIETTKKRLDEKGRALYKGAKGGAYYVTKGHNRVYVNRDTVRKRLASNHKKRKRSNIHNNTKNFSIDVKQFAPLPPIATRTTLQPSIVDKYGNMTPKGLKWIQRLQLVHSEHNDEEKDNDIVHTADLLYTLNGFECILRQDENNIFELIFNQLHDCDVSRCISFQRNYRSRSPHDDNHSLYDTNDDTQIAYRQIMDKVHCYLYHSYDTGNRLYVKEQNRLKNKEKRFIALKDILHKKATQKKSNIIAMKQIRRRMCQRFRQLTDIMNDKYVQKSFIFGCEFHYDSDDKTMEGSAETVKTLHFSPKYRNQKEELTEHKVCRLTIQQYINENTKAEVTHDTYIRKKYYKDISKDHLLCLMIYCNYDALQYEFSKTYRDHSGIQHNNFYHFGRLLKEAVLDHGTAIRDTTLSPKRFYHGITQPLVPSQIVGDLGKGVAIFCPLSTSTSYIVAVNTFTNQNEGVVIEFGGDRSKAKYFNVAWLSDYANENECLFLQNKHELRINNITDCQMGCEYKHILDALKTLDSVLVDDYYQDDKVIKTRCESMKLLIVMLRCLAYIPCKYKFSKYEKQLVNVYVTRKTTLNVNYSVLEQNYIELFELFCNKGSEWINVTVLSTVFPNVVNVTVKNIRLTHDLMKQHLLKSFWIWNLDRMIVKTQENSALTVADAVAHYKERFNQYDITLTHLLAENGNSHSFSVEKQYELKQ